MVVPAVLSADDWLQVVLGALVASQMCLAAVIDAREHRFPNMLAILFALSCALFSVSLGGVGGLAISAFQAAACCLPLVGFETVWRRRHDGASGLGMGDVKYLFASMLVSPFGAMCAFALGLIALAGTGLLCGRRTLPLLPFVVGGNAVLFLAANVL